MVIKYSVIWVGKFWEIFLNYFNLVNVEIFIVNYKMVLLNDNIL